MNFKRCNAQWLAYANWQKGLLSLVKGGLLSLVMTTGGMNMAMAEVLQSGKTVYVGRTQPEPTYHPRHQVIKKSSGYDRNNGRNNDRRYSQQPSVSANFYYQAPSTTTITRNVQIIPPQNGVGDVYYSQDSYYLYPPQPVSRPYYQRPFNRPYQPLVPVTIDPQDTENRSKQWTDTSDFSR